MFSVTPLIEKGEAHRITCTGRSPLVTLNLYVPPAYTAQGDLRMIARLPTVGAALRALRG